MINEKAYNLLHFCIILRKHEKMFIIHFHQLCLIYFIGKDEVFHGLLFLYNPNINPLTCERLADGDRHGGDPHQLPVVVDH